MGHPLTEISAATVDVYVLRRRPPAELDVLLLQRASGTRCAGAWEVVHGRIEPDERPEDAAVREVHEETRLPVERLYTVGVQPFYLPMLGEGTITLAVVFAAFVDADTAPRLGAEHGRARWVPIAAAADEVTWPRSRRALGDIAVLLAGGDAGPVEDVLRVR